MDYRAVKHQLIARLRNELSDKLFYHGLHHTLDVLRVAAELCTSEGINGQELTLVKTAALFHDAGFVKNKHQGHELEGCNMAREILPRFGYNDSDVALVCNMIISTKVPQTPQNLLEEIICDADLDYLGRDDFHKIGNSLFEELQAYQMLNDEQTWNRLQVSFLTTHHFHTRTNRELREPVKQRYLVQLKDLVSTY